MGVTMQGLDIRKMRDMVARLENPAPILNAVGKESLRLVTKAFEDEKAPSGTPWKPFRQWRVKSKGAEMSVPTRTGKVLNRTGHLKRSFRYETSGRRVTVFSDVFYAPTHQYGATIRPKRARRLAFTVGGRWGRKYRMFAKEVHIPARPMLPNSGSVPPSWAWHIRFAIVAAMRAEVSRAG